MLGWHLVSLQWSGHRGAAVCAAALAMIGLTKSTHALAARNQCPPIVLSIAHDLVLDPLQILEEESVVTWRRIFGILAWWTHYRGPYSLQLRMQPINFSAGCRSERKMM